MASSADYGAFIPTTYMWDPSQINQLEIDPQLKELLVRMYQQVFTLAQGVNNRGSGMYSDQEFVTGKQWIQQSTQTSTTSNQNTLRAVWRKVIDTGTLPNAGTSTTAHGLTFNSGTTFTQIYGAASDPTGIVYLPLPYASPTAANNIEVNVDTTNVNIITGSNRTAFTRSFVVLEYMQT